MKRDYDIRTREHHWCTGAGTQGKKVESMQMGPGNILEAKSDSVFKQSRLCIMTNVRNVMYGTVKVIGRLDEITAK